MQSQQPQHNHPLIDKHSWSTSQLKETAPGNILDVLLRGELSIEQNAKVTDNRWRLDGDIADRWTAVVTGQFEHVGIHGSRTMRTPTATDVMHTSRELQIRSVGVAVGY